MISIIAGFITLVGAIAIALIAWFIAVHRTPSQPPGEATPALYRVRFRYFIALVVVLIVCFAISMPMVPYVSKRWANPDMVVNATGHMWYWDLSAQSAPDQAAAPVTSIPRGTLVEFDVTSADVNHGFGLYNDDGRLVAQTQAMPGYVNRLRYRFDVPGTYHILCLEFCGVAHHAMFANIEVK